MQRDEHVSLRVTLCASLSPPRRESIQAGKKDLLFRVPA